MDIHTIHIIFSGILSLKCYFFFFFEIPEKQLVNAKTKKEIDEIMEPFKLYPNSEIIKATITWVKIDNFKNPDTLRTTKNRLYFTQLELIKKEFLKYFFEKMIRLVSEN